MVMVLHWPLKYVCWVAPRTAVANSTRRGSFNKEHVHITHCCLLTTTDRYPPMATALQFRQNLTASCKENSISDLEGFVEHVDLELWTL